jgi:hypothetical protein
VNQEHNKIDAVDQNLVAQQAFSVDMNPEKVEIPPTRMQRKMTRLFGSGKATSNLFFTGFQMGAAVGASFGGIFGLWQMVQTRSFLVLPMSMFASGISFGFFMGIGMTFRAGDM